MTKTQKIQSPERDPVGSFEHAVLALFEGPLSAVGFPGVDRAVLLEAVRAANEAQLVVEAAERDLEHSRRELGDKMTELGKLARRALAYARVLAEDDASLADKLESLSPRTTEPARTPRKRRVRSESTAMLPTLASASEKAGSDDAGDEEIAAE
jgi:hypothetical protein